MKYIKSKSVGYNILEILMTLAILALLMALSTYWYNAAQTASVMKTTTDSVVSTINKAKNDAISGKNGSSYGVKFSTSTYISFSGNSYDSNNANNITFPINNSFSLSSSFSSSNPDSVIIFNHSTGITGTMATITITQISNTSNKKSILIGNQGDISVIQ